MIDLFKAPFFKNVTKVNLVASYTLPTMKNGKFKAIPLYYCILCIAGNAALWASSKKIPALLNRCASVSVE